MLTLIIIKREKFLFCDLFSDYIKNRINNYQNVKMLNDDYKLE